MCCAAMAPPLGAWHIGLPLQMGITAEDYRNSQAEASEAVAEDPLPGLSTLSLIAVLGGAAVLRPKRHENA